MKEAGLQIVACHEKANTSLYKADLRAPSAIIVGAEDQGIAAQYLKMADKSVKIPMKGPIASLNVSVAAAIILYEGMRQRSL